ncbi:MAG: hypothetical protein ACRC6X_01465 [Culicoidibacterales bacterium]
MKQLNKAKKTIYEYIKHCIVEQRDSNEKRYLRHSPRYAAIEIVCLKTYTS